MGVLFLNRVQGYGAVHEVKDNFGRFEFNRIAREIQEGWACMGCHSLIFIAGT